MKRRFALAAAAVMLSCSAVMAEDDITVCINDKEIDFSKYDNAMPYIENDRVMIPIRAVAEGLGAEVKWYPEDETIRIDGDILLEINNDIAWVGDDKFILDSPAVLRHSRTYIPLRFVSESLGAKVEWVNADRTVKITTSKPVAEKPAEDTTQTSQPTQTADTYDGAVYLGVEDYGTMEKELKDTYKHRFFVNGKTESYSIANDAAYSIQNTLCEGYVYKLGVQDGVIVSAQAAVPVSGGEKGTVYKINTAPGRASIEEIQPEDGVNVDVYKNGSAFVSNGVQTYVPPVSGTAGEKTLKNFIKTAMTPVGHTLYVYGGGWNWQDDGSSIQSRTIGLPKTWTDFFEKNNANYTYRTESWTTTYYPHNGVNQYYFAGADCSGFVGWAVYNTMNTQSGGIGYVGASTKMARTFAEEYNFGTWTQEIHKEDFRPGDIMSMNGHVWIYLGGCDDGSAVIIHSTPSDSKNGMPGGGVQLAALGGADSKAYALVQKYMTKFYPDWSARYTPEYKNFNSYTSFEGDNAGRFSWNSSTLSDPDGYSGKSADEILSDLFGE